MNLLLALQQVNLEEKINKAPDANYQIGNAIGSFLPFGNFNRNCILYVLQSKK